MLLTKLFYIQWKVNNWLFVLRVESCGSTFFRPGPEPENNKNFGTQIRIRPELFPTNICQFCVHDQIKNQDFSYLLVSFRKKVNISYFFLSYLT
jgi:hypothetical protein